MSVCLLAAISCGITTEVSQERTVSSANTTMDSLSLRSQIENIVRETVGTSSSIEMEELVEVVTERFSEPDSAGHTHMAEKTTARYSSSTRGKSRTDTVTEQEHSASTDKDSLSVRKDTSTIHDINKLSEQRVQIKRTPWPVRTLAWIGGIALLCLVFFLLKKFRVI